MKVKVKPWNDAAMAALHDDDDWSVEADSIYGIIRGFGSWGKVVDGYVGDDVFYANDGLTYPLCVVEECDESIEDIDSDDLLCYGEVITDDQIYSPNIRIRLIAYNGNLYYHKMRGGEVIECRRVGAAYA